jgi:hypothetical protein
MSSQGLIRSQQSVYDQIIAADPITDVGRVQRRTLNEIPIPEFNMSEVEERVDLHRPTITYERERTAPRDAFFYGVDQPLPEVTS